MKKLSIRITIYILIIVAVIFRKEILAAVMWLWGKIGSWTVLAGILFLIAVFILVELLYRRFSSFDRAKEETTESLTAKDGSKVTAFYIDSPADEDDLNRADAAELLLKKIIMTFNEERSLQNSFVIHIGEHYGNGKTTFLNLLRKEAKDHRVIMLEYRPWLCESERGMLQEFFSIFKKGIGRWLPKLGSEINEYIRLLMASMDVIGLSRASDAFLKYWSLPKNSLKDTHKQIYESLEKIDRPIIVTIDDVDRLQSNEVLMLLKLIRDIADFPNVFYIVAADGSHLSAMLEKEGIANPELYLEKFFNVEFQFPGDQRSALDNIASQIEEKLAVKNIPDWEKTISRIRSYYELEDYIPNIRFEYKLLNSYFLHLDSIDSALGVDCYQLFLLTFIEVLDPEIYKILRDNPLQIFNTLENPTTKDKVLTLKKDVDIKGLRWNKVTRENFKEISASKGIQTSSINNADKETAIIDYAELKRKLETDGHEMVISILHELFADKDYVAVSDIRRLNMYYRYFLNEKRDDDIDQMEMLDLMTMPLEKYQSALEGFKDRPGKREVFLGELYHTIEYLEITSDKILERVFLFEDMLWECEDDKSRYHNCFEYFDSLQIFRILPVFNKLYGLKEYNSRSKKDEKLSEEFKSLCERDGHLAILIPILERVIPDIDYYTLDQESLRNCSEKLALRYFDEVIAPSNGKLTKGMGYVIESIQDGSGQVAWREKFQEWLLGDERRFLNVCYSMVNVNDHNQMYWTYPLASQIFEVNYYNGVDELSQKLKAAYPNERTIKLIDILFGFYRSGITSKGLDVQINREPEKQEELKRMLREIREERNSARTSSDDSAAEKA